MAVIIDESTDFEKLKKEDWSKPVDVTLIRDFYFDNQYWQLYTICLPFALTQKQANESFLGASIAYFGGYTNIPQEKSYNMGRIRQQGSLPAGIPFMLSNLPTGITQLTFNNVLMDFNAPAKEIKLSESNASLVGNYESVTVEASDYEFGFFCGDVGKLSNQSIGNAWLYYPIAPLNVKMPPCSAYLKISSMEYNPNFHSQQSPMIIYNNE